MPQVTTYRHFTRSTEAAFLFYRTVFGGELVSPIQRLGDMPASPGQPPMTDDIKPLVLHVALSILGGHVLMGTDAPASMGFTRVQGNNVYINLEPDTRGETLALFTALADGGTVDMALQDMFWGGYNGSLADRFGIRWMFNCASTE